LRKKVPTVGAKHLAKTDWNRHVNFLPDASPLQPHRPTARKPGNELTGLKANVL